MVKSKEEIIECVEALSHELDEIAERLKLDNERKNKAKDALAHYRKEALAAFDGTKEGAKRAQTMLDKMRSEIHHHKPFFNKERVKRYALVIGLGATCAGLSLFFPPLIAVSAACIGYLAIDVVAEVMPKFLNKEGEKILSSQDKAHSKQDKVYVDTELLKLTIVAIASVGVFFVAPVIGMAGIAYVAGEGAKKIARNTYLNQAPETVTHLKKEMHARTTQMDPELAKRIHEEVAWYEGMANDAVVSQKHHEASIAITAITHLTDPARLKHIHELHQLKAQAEALKKLGKLDEADHSALTSFQHHAEKRFDDAGLGPKQAVHAYQVVAQFLSDRATNQWLPEGLTLKQLCHLCSDTMNAKEPNKILEASKALNAMGEKIGIQAVNLTDPQEKAHRMQWSQRCKTVAKYGLVFGLLVASVALVVFCPPVVGLMGVAFAAYIGAEMMISKEKNAQPKLDVPGHSIPASPPMDTASQLYKASLNNIRQTTRAKSNPTPEPECPSFHP